MTTNTNTPALANATARISTNGRLLGHEMKLGTMSLSEAKESGRALGLKGRKLSEYAFNVMNNEKQASIAKAIVVVNMSADEGFTANLVRSNAKDTKRILEMVRSTADKAKGTKAAKQAAEIDALKNEIECLKAALAANKTN